MKKFVTLLLTLVLTTTCCAALADSQYTIFFSAEEMAGTTDLNGFLSAQGMTELNTLVLKDDGTYELTKLVGTLNDEHVPADIEMDGQTLRATTVTYVYTGTYTRNGDQVTLNIPDECVFSEDWGALADLGFLTNSKGTATAGDRVVNYEGTNYDPMDNFGSPVYKFAGHDAPVNVTVNADGTYTYNAVASSDDE